MAVVRADVLERRAGGEETLAAVQLPSPVQMEHFVMKEGGSQADTWERRNQRDGPTPAWSTDMSSLLVAPSPPHQRVADLQPPALVVELRPLAPEGVHQLALVVGEVVSLQLQ